MQSILENQRHYGVAGWLNPTPFDRNRWTTTDGLPVSLSTEQLPSVDDHWTVECTELTDDEGWIYSTSFAHIGYPRDGGRACKRSTDRVRQRQWNRTHDSNSVTKQASPVQKRRPVDAQRGLNEFLTLFAEVNSRRKIWEYLPWDPVAWLLVHAEHQEYLNSFESLQLNLNECVTLKSEEGIDSLLMDLELGVRVSRAAYGYVMAAGHLNTIENFIALHAIHHHYFDPVAGASVNANLEAVESLAGYSKADIVMSDWCSREYRPCHFIAVDSERESIVLAIRGTVEMGDVVTDISGAPWTLEIAGVTGKVHKGLMDAAIYLRCQTAPQLADLFEKHPGWTLFITGHSLGGGVAALLSMILKFESGLPSTAGRLQCVAVASAAVMSENLAEMCKEFVISLVLRCDVVPRLSAFSIEALMVELASSSPAKRTVESVLNSATSAMQSIKQTITQFQSGLKQEEFQPQRVSDLRLVQELAKDERVCNGALHAVQHEQTRSNGGRRSTSIQEAEDNPTQTNPIETFSPLFPAGRVLWLLGSTREEKINEDNQQWWQQLQSWCMTNLKKSADALDRQSQKQPTDEKTAQNLTWFEEWLKRSIKSSETEDNHLNKTQKCSPEDNASSARNARTNPAEIVLIEAERKSFSRLLIHPLMMQDHLPIAYVESIRQLMQRFSKRNATPINSQSQENNSPST